MNDKPRCPRCENEAVCENCGRPCDYDSEMCLCEECESCGIPIPEMPEDASPDELLCDACLVRCPKCGSAATLPAEWWSEGRRFCEDCHYTWKEES